MSLKLEFDPLENVIPAFITPIGHFKLPSHETLNAALKTVILEREQNDTGITRSNLGGWHSKQDLLQWPQPEISDLQTAFKQAVVHMSSLITKEETWPGNIALSAWANVNRPGSFNALHTHAQYHWSGVYYVEPGDYSDDDLPKPGHLIIQDPRGAAITMYPHPMAVEQVGNMQFKPEAGLLLVFPSWLPHSVNPFQSDTQRISISFNARLQSKGANPSPIALA